MCGNKNIVGACVRAVLFFTFFGLLIVLPGCRSSDLADNHRENIWDRLLSAQSYGDKIRVGNNRWNSTKALLPGQTNKQYAAIYRGDERLVGQPKLPGYTTTENGQGITLNLVNASVGLVAKTVLGDILKLNYVVDNQVEANMTIQTTSPVSKASLIDILETTLANYSIAIVHQDEFYRLVPASSQAAKGSRITLRNGGMRRVGSTMQIVPLNYVSAREIQSVLEPLAKPGSILKVDENRNLLILSGTQSELRSMNETIEIFDVDWMRGRSIGLFPIQNSEPKVIAKELENIFGAKDGPLRGAVKFLPNERLNSIIVISKKSRYITRAQKWITRLDKVAQSNERQLFVYDIQNRPAEELANLLQSVFEDESGKKISISNNVAPNQQAINASTEGQVPNSVADINDININVAKPSYSIHVTADISNNALLIRATSKEFQRILKIMKKIDVLPTQVLLEAVIAEVTLNDELKFGLRWFFEHGKFSLKFTDALGGLVNSVFPGFSYSFANNDIQLVVNALAGITDVNIISSPTLMVLDNQSATLQVGDQVPIITQTATSVAGGNAPIINTVSLKDTGIILTVTPRINERGRVLLNITQEVSDVVETTTSGIDSPTIRQRKINTSVIVQDGQSLALGGLIQDKNTIRKTQVPVLGDVPLFGLLFKNKKDTITRTELIIFIKPSVIHNVNDANRVTQAYREQVALQGPKARYGRSTFERDLIRLAN
ncbi:MAG: type II secretion system secretin GspD [Hyphomicrobiales bacterium]|nr:type II secretion system secretin GspD [Hyphomicrobiales bacterium]